MNRNYQKGVRLEREIVESYRSAGGTALRSAGSHSPIDVVGISKDSVVDFVQCKVTESEAQAKRLCDAFQAAPPLPLGPYRQMLVVKVIRKGRKTVIIERNHTENVWKRSAAQELADPPVFPKLR